MKIILTTYSQNDLGDAGFRIYNSMTQETASAKTEGTMLNWEIPRKSTGHYLKIFAGRSSSVPGYFIERKAYYLFQRNNSVYCVENGWERLVCSIPISKWFSTVNVNALILRGDSLDLPLTILFQK